MALPVGLIWRRGPFLRPDLVVIELKRVAEADYQILRSLADGNSADLKRLAVRVDDRGRALGHAYSIGAPTLNSA